MNINERSPKVVLRYHSERIAFLGGGKTETVLLHFTIRQQRFSLQQQQYDINSDLDASLQFGE